MKNVFKSKYLVSFFSLVMAITMLMVPTVAFANSNTEASVIQPRWSYLVACDNLLDYASNISSGLLVYGSTQPRFGNQSSVEIQLQKWNVSAGKWENVTGKYWFDYSTDGYSELCENNVPVSAGVYRLSLLHTAYSSTGVELESFAAYSNELTIVPSN